MKSIPGATMVSTHLRVNGIVFTQVGLRPNHTSPSEVDIVVRDARLGTFTLHEEFVLEIAESTEGVTTWRELSYLELKRLVARQVGTPEPRHNREATSPANLAPEVEEASRSEVALEPFPRIPVEDDNSHLGRAEKAFTEKGIRFRLVGGQGSCGRHWGHATYVVSDLLGARKCLHRAGFLPATASKYLFTDTRNGWSMRLLPVRSQNSFAKT